MSDWGKGLVNSDNWGRGAVNDFQGWGIYQRDSHAGDTVIFGMAEIFKKRVTDDSGTFEALSCVITFIKNI